MGHFRMIISGIGAFVPDHPFESHPSPAVARIDLLFPEHTQDRAIRIGPRPRFCVCFDRRIQGAIPSHFGHCVCDADLLRGGDNLRQPEVRFRHAGARARERALYFLCFERLEVFPDGVPSTEPLVPHWVDPGEEDEGSLCWVPAIDGLPRENLLLEPPNLSDELIARTVIEAGDVRVHALTQYADADPREGIARWKLAVPGTPSAIQQEGHQWMAQSVRWTLQFKDFVEIRLTDNRHPDEGVSSIYLAPPEGGGDMVVELANRELEDLLRPPFPRNKLGVTFDEDFSIYYDLLEGRERGAPRPIPVLEQPSSRCPNSFGGGAGGSGKPCTTAILRPSS